MDWNQLLSQKRIRELSGGSPTSRDDGEVRGEILRDYGRAVFSTPVRRLQDKTQVFPLERIDGVRTRLTHSIEVSSMARGLAHGVCRELIKNKKISTAQAYEIETIAATCGLLHDVGNPPFGHFGEDAIRSWFVKRGESNPSFFSSISCGDSQIEFDFKKFEGNAQTVRLMCKLQVLSDRFGLNLTAATISALGKYTARSTEAIDPANKGKQSKKKLGYFKSEEALVELVRNETGTGDKRNPIAFLVEAADDMTYASVDIEDGIKKGIVTWEMLAEEIKSWEDPGADKILQKVESAISKSSIIENICSSQQDEGRAQYLRTFLSTAATKAVQTAFIENYDSIMAGGHDVEILYTTNVGRIFDKLKIFAKKHVYSSKDILKLEILGNKVIHTLLDIFWDADRTAPTQKLAGKSYALMSQNYRTIYETTDQFDAGLPDEYRRALLITDYISGMTDSFALHLYQELTHG
ncbi:MAG: dNTP triphosphohydrolase [Verrucomicrobiaceae bacterium]|nr:MAG: dNTP triphosphohydrolase [Verrucomicrobiaceae bacterium]